MLNNLNEFLNTLIHQLTQVLLLRTNFGEQSAHKKKAALAGSFLIKLYNITFIL